MIENLEPEPLGHPENPRTRRASLDAVLLAQAVHRGDEAAQTGEAR